jgi:uncharacterized repeat protein (TIGR03943 family)
VSRPDPTRAIRAVALTAWAAFFAWLWISGEQSRFIGPKTAWVVPAGAFALTIAALAQLATVRTSGPASRPTVGEVLGAIVLLVPILMMMTIPDPSLGALAAQRKSAKNVRLQAPDKVSVKLDLFAVAYASQDPEFAQKLGAVPGRRVSVSGLLTHPDPSTAGLAVVRFRIRCCVADAIPYSVPVVPSGGEVPVTHDDQWVAVDGVLAAAGEGRLQILATSVRPMATPDDPYN